MTRFPKYLQDSENSCGAYCIKMILSYFHFDDEIQNIKRRCRMTKDGITVYGLCQALKEYHIEAKAYRCSFKELYHQLKVPAIAHLKTDQYYHYVVIYKMHDEYFLLGDPARGIVKMSYEAFHEQFTGVVIMIEHVGHPVESLHCYSFSSFIKDHLVFYRHDIINLTFKTALMTLFSLLFSLYYQLMIDCFGDFSYFQILVISLLFAGIYALRLLFDFYRKMQILALRSKLNERYVAMTVQNLIYQDFSYFLQYEKGIILSRANHLLQLSDYFIELYQAFFMNLIIIFMTVLFMLYIHFIFLVLSVIMIVAVIMVCLYLNHKIHLKNRNMLEYKEKLDHGILEFQENFFMTVQFKMKRMMKNKIACLYQSYIDQEYDKGDMISHFQLWIEALIQSFLMLTTLIGLYLFCFHEMSLGTVLLVYMMFSYLIEPLIQISSFLLLSDEMKIVFERYKEMIPEKKKYRKKIRTIQSIQFKDVTFSYGYGRPIFEHLDFEINHSMVILGDIGCGKSTFLKLVSRQLHAVKGCILVNHKNIETIDLNSFYAHIRYLDQNPVFYEESLLFNMLLDDSLKHSRMLELLDYFQLDFLIPSLSLKLDMKGGFLSAGQAQLIMIIRALLSDVDVLILDEAFSHVDAARVQLLLSYLSSLDKIVIIVAHQINVMNNDYDYVIIKEGKLVREVKNGNRSSNNQ